MSFVYILYKQTVASGLKYIEDREEKAADLAAFSFVMDSNL